jgi:hypothetical protein
MSLARRANLLNGSAAVAAILLATQVVAPLRARVRGTVTEFAGFQNVALRQGFQRQGIG